MRVIVNQSTALGARTGIGHYTLDLLRALRTVAPTDTFDVFPPNWWGSVRQLASSVRPRAGHQRTGGSWKNALLRRLRDLGERALAGYLRAAAWWGNYGTRTGTGV